MSKTISELKPDLEQIAEILNKFQSPSVQDRLAELLFGRVFDGHEVEKPHPRAAGKTNPPSPAPRKATEKSHEGKPERRRSSGGRVGGKKMLDTLIAEGFFKGHKRSLGDIIAHAKLKKATEYTPQDFSSALGRLARSNTLEREPNEEKQFVYWVP